MEQLKDSTKTTPFQRPTTQKLEYTLKTLQSLMALSARIYMPDNLNENTKIPLFINLHGGAFCLYSSSSSIYHNYLNSLVSKANPGRVAGLVLVNPFFGEDGENPLWEFLCPNTDSRRDLRLNPALDPTRLRRELGCGKVLVCVGEKDFLKGKAVKLRCGRVKEEDMFFICISLSVMKLRNS